MSKIDYDAPAGIYRSPRSISRSWRSCQRLTFTRFPSLAEAIKNAVEDKREPSGFISIETSDGDLDAVEIRRLYESAGFPLERRKRDPQRSSRKPATNPNRARRSAKRAGRD